MSDIIKQREEEIIEEFSFFDDWEGKYEYLIDTGKSLEPYDEKYKTDDRLIKGCQSRVWLFSHLVDGKVNYLATSDAIITKGLIALIIRVLNNLPPKDIMEAELLFIEKIGLAENLSPTRANGLLSMIKQMKLDAMALQSA